MGNYGLNGSPKSRDFPQAVMNAATNETSNFDNLYGTSYAQNVSNRATDGSRGPPSKASHLIPLLHSPPRSGASRPLDIRASSYQSYILRRSSLEIPRDIRTKQCNGMEKEYPWKSIIL